MIKPLRKRHLQIWSLMAALLPIGIVVSWLVIPDSVPIKTVRPVNVELLPVIKFKRESKQYCVHIRTNKENNKWQLEWKNKLTLTVPSAVIYKGSPGLSGEGVLRSFTPGNSQLVGRIESSANYVFDLPPDSTGYDKPDFILYDFIHEQVIDTINFQP